MNHESINITRELVLQHCSALFRIHIYSLIYIYMRCDLGEIPKHTYTRCAVCGQQFAYASWALARSTFCTDIYTLSFASSTRSCNMLKCSHLWCVWHGFGVYAATEMPLWLSYNTTQTVLWIRTHRTAMFFFFYCFLHIRTVEFLTRKPAPYAHTFDDARTHSHCGCLILTIWVQHLCHNTSRSTRHNVFIRLSCALVERPPLKSQTPKFIYWARK